MSNETQKKMEPGPGDVIEPVFEDGKPDAPDTWRQKLEDRKKRLDYLKTGERYWYGESFGSERRKSKV
jgi:hypothetical protein